MKTAIYPGSFAPWHDGHLDILKKAMGVFDKIYVCSLINPEKTLGTAALSLSLENWEEVKRQLLESLKEGIYKSFTLQEMQKIEVRHFDGLLVDLVEELKADAIVRGLRNGSDLQYEQNTQYWNEDLGLTVPTVLFITDRRLGHISSSAIRAIGKFKKQSDKK